MFIENAVLLNLRDSVSRIVDNLGFTSIDEAAHARLVGLIAEKLDSMSNTCRALLENSGRTGISLNTDIDLKHLFRIHHVDVEGLVDYTKQVQPFPPKKWEIHGEASAKKPNKNNGKDAENAAKSNKIPLRKHPTPPSYIELPVFDDLTDLELGFCFDEPPETPAPIPPRPVPSSSKSSLIPPQPSSSRILLPPPPPPPIPPIFFSPPFEIPTFDPEIPSPLMPNYMTPGPLEPPVKLKIFKADPPITSSYSLQKSEKSEKYRQKTSRKLEKIPSSSSISAQKMTKKRLMQTNYERRLRLEQMAKEEKKKERIYEKRMKVEAEQQRKIKEKKVEKVEKKTEKLPKLVFKFNRNVIDEMRKREYEKSSHPESISHHNEITAPTTDENDNKMITAPLKKRKLAENGNGSVLSSVKEKEEVVENSRKPLNKMFIQYHNVYKGMLIKRITTTSYYSKDGKWEPFEHTWKRTNGIFSQPMIPQKPAKRPSIPKLKLIKNADNSYSKI